MNYEVKLTHFAISQIQDIIRYISNDLQSTDTAIAWADFLYKEISSLNLFPNRFPLIDTEPWKSKKIHKMIVKNFIVYYIVDEEKKCVWITAVIYSKRNQLEQLKKIPL